MTKPGMQNWDDYRFFLAVTKQGSLSAAARTLNVSQPTVARRLEQLETTLGQPLVQRMGATWQITSAGQEVLRFVERIEREVTAIDRIRARSPADRPVVRLATTRGLATYWLAPRIARLEQETEARLSVHVGVARADLSHYQADVALRMGHPTDDALHGRQVGTVHCGLYASQTYLESAGAPQTRDDLKHHDVLESVGSIAQIPQVQTLRDAAAPNAFRIEADCVAVQIALTQQDLGIVALPCFMADPHDDLVRVLGDDFDIPVPLWALVNAHLKTDPVVRPVFEFVVREALAYAPAFRGEPRNLADL